MAERTRKTASQDEPEGGVLAGLPATRPNRMGRRARPAADAAAEAPAAASAKPAARKAKPKAAPKAAAKPKAKAAARKKPAAAKPTVEAGATPSPTPIAEGRKPRPVRAGHPGLADRSAQDRPDQREDEGGVAATVVQAAGDLAALGVSAGASVLKGIGKRLPRP